MKTKSSSRLVAALFYGAALSLCTNSALRADEPAAKKAFIDGTGPGWVALGAENFVKVNCDDETWTFPDGEIHCTGQPIGVTRSAKEYKNFELVVEWMHLKHAGNSGLFIWTLPKAIEELTGPGLPKAGIEVQVLDLGYAEDYFKKNGKESDWFTCHGDIFPVGESKLKPFPPLSANGSRSFPSKNLSKGVGEWNHYYVRAINGEVRLWVNGEEVSGGSGAVPAAGYICLESEGSPIKFKNLRIRELP
jgi:3-keto-disaccharide hydrolase